MSSGEATAASSVVQEMMHQKSQINVKKKQKTKVGFNTDITFLNSCQQFQKVKIQKLHEVSDFDSFHINFLITINFLDIFLW